MLGGTSRSSRSLRRILVSDNFEVAADRKHRDDSAATSPDKSKTKPALSGSLTFQSMQPAKKKNAVGTCVKKVSSSLESVDHIWWSILSLLAILAWSCFCAWGGIYLNNHRDSSQIWIDWIGGMTEPVRFLGVLFTFALIFRFHSESIFLLSKFCLASHSYYGPVSIALINHSPLGINNNTVRRSLLWTMVRWTCYLGTHYLLHY